MEKLLKILFKSACTLIVLAIVIVGRTIDFFIALLINFEDDNQTDLEDHSYGPYYNMTTGKLDSVKNGGDFYADDLYGENEINRLGK